MKLTWQRLVIFFVILGFSVGFGFAFDAAAHRIDLNRYPQEPTYAAMITENAAAFGVPEAIIWAVIDTESEFVSNAVSDTGEIGLMQITPEEMSAIYREILHEDPPDAGLLYDPKTNLRAGVARLSALYRRYGVWRTVFAAWEAGEAVIDQWILSDENRNDLGQITRYPNRATEQFVSKAEKATEMYTKLYYETTR